MSYETITIDTDARGVATVTLNLPDKHNALAPQMIADLTDAAAALAADGSVRVVISKRPPAASLGVSNWIDTRGHREGTVVFRWSRSKQLAPDIAAQVLPLDGAG